MKDTDDAPDPLLLFTLGDWYCGIEIESINEVLLTDRLLPNASAGRTVETIEHCGRTTRVVNPAHVLETDGGDSADHVILFDGEGDQQVGWIVDRAHEVTSLSNPTVESVPEEEYVNGVVQNDSRSALWIDIHRVNAALTHHR